MHADLAKTIDDAFEKRNEVSPSTKGPVREAVETALDLLDRALGLSERRTLQLNTSLSPFVPNGIRPAGRFRHRISAPAPCPLL
jgi:hypothetical protein